MTSPDSKQAHAMLDAFASVGTKWLYLTLLDVDENQHCLGWRSRTSCDADYRANWKVPVARA
jgi:hypothetical protein